MWQSTYIRPSAPTLKPPAMWFWLRTDVIVDASEHRSAAVGPSFMIAGNAEKTPRWS